MEELEVFGIVMLSEKFEAKNLMSGEVMYATGFVPTRTVNKSELSKNPQWQKMVPLGFYPVTIAKGPKNNYCQFQLFAVEGLPWHIRAFVTTAAPVVVQEWLGKRLQQKYGDEALKEWNEAFGAGE
jgi:hypothetical protein